MCHSIMSYDITLYTTVVLMLIYDGVPTLIRAVVVAVYTFHGSMPDAHYVNKHACCLVVYTAHNTMRC